MSYYSCQYRGDPNDSNVTPKHFTFRRELAIPSFFPVFAKWPYTFPAVAHTNGTDYSVQLHGLRSPICISNLDKNSAKMRIDWMLKEVESIHSASYVIPNASWLMPLTVYVM